MKIDSSMIEGRRGVGEEGGRGRGGEGGRISKGRGIINERERKEWWNETGREWKEEKLTN